MLAKLNLISAAFARHERVKRQNTLTRKQWINVDRIVMIALFAGVIAGAIIFS